MQGSSPQTGLPAARRAKDVHADAALAGLRKELEGLRAAGTLRGLIEQAKGILMAREGIDQDAAFARLRTLSQQHNVKLVEVAASIVALTAPSPLAGSPGLDEVMRQTLPAPCAPSPQWRTLRSELSEDLHAAALEAVAARIEDGAEAARLLRDLLEWTGAPRVVVFRLSAGGALTMIGQAGIPDDVASAFSHIPPIAGIPLIDVAASGQPGFWRTRAERDRDFPAAAGAALEFQASAVIPVRPSASGGPPIGVVGLTWPHEREFPAADKTRIIALVDRVTRLFLHDARAVVPELSGLSIVRALLLDPWIVLQHVTDDGSAQPEFLIHDASERVLADGVPVGRRLLEVWPEAGTDESWAELVALARAGGIWTSTVRAPASLPWGRPGTVVRGVRLGRYLVVGWRSPVPTPGTNRTATAGVRAIAGSRRVMSR